MAKPASNIINLPSAHHPDTHDDAQTIIDLGMMLVTVLVHPDAAGCLDGMNHTVWQMIYRAQAIQERGWPDEVAS